MTNDFERDPADLNGDGEFDVIDISILEEEKDGRKLKHDNRGCCVLLMILGSSIGVTAWGVTHFLKFSKM